MIIRKTYIYEPSDLAYIIGKIKEIELLRLKFRYIEIRYREDQARDEHGRFIDEGGSSASGSDNGGNDLTDHSVNGIIIGEGEIKNDFNGVPYTKPELHLPKAEYGKVIRLIDDDYYAKYEGKAFGIARTSTSKYFFEVRGYNDYNIYAKSKIK